MTKKIGSDLYKSITLEVTHPESADGKVEGFRYFWAYYVDGYRPETHCQPCFIGAPVPQFNSSTVRVGIPVVLDRTAQHDFVYVCGVGAGPDKELYRRNFHLPLRYEEGRSVSAVTYNGYTVTAQNAVLLQVPALRPDLLTDAEGKPLLEKQTRCRNFQFAVEYYGHPSLSRRESSTLLP